MGDEVEALVEQLGHESELKRRWAHEELRRLGLGAARAIPHLIPRLSSDWPEWQESARTLGAIGPLAISELQILLVTAESAQTRAASAVALEHAGPASLQALSELVRALEDESEKVVRHAAIALGELGELATPAIAPLCRALKRQAATSSVGRALAKIGPATASALRAALEESLTAGVPQRAVAIASIEALGCVEPLEETTGIALAGVLLGGPRELTHFAAEALKNHGSASEWVLPAIRTHLSGSSQPSPYVYQVLGAIGTESAALVLGAALRRHPAHSRAIVGSLRDMGAAAAGALPELSLALQSTDSETRYLAVHAIGGIGQEAASAVEVLTQVLQDDEPKVRESVISALGCIGTPRAVESLVDLMARPSPLLGEVYVLSALKSCGPAAGPALPFLRSRVRSTEGRRRQQLIETIGMLGPAGMPAIPDLIEALYSTEDWTPTRAAEALSKLGPLAMQAIFDDDNARGWRERPLTLDRILEEFSADALPGFAEGIERPEPHIRASCVRRLAELASTTPGAIDLLIAASRDAEDEVRNPAVVTLAAVDRLRFDRHHVSREDDPVDMIRQFLARVEAGEFRFDRPRPCSREEGLKFDELVEAGLEAAGRGLALGVKEKKQRRDGKSNYDALYVRGLTAAGRRYLEAGRVREPQEEGDATEQGTQAPTIGGAEPGSGFLTGVKRKSQSSNRATVLTSLLDAQHNGLVSEVRAFRREHVADIEVLDYLVEHKAIRQSAGTYHLTATGLAQIMQDPRAQADLDSTVKLIQAIGKARRAEPDQHEWALGYLSRIVELTLQEATRACLVLAADGLIGGYSPLPHAQHLVQQLNIHRCEHYYDNTTETVDEFRSRLQRAQAGPWDARASDSNPPSTTAESKDCQHHAPSTLEGHTVTDQQAPENTNSLDITVFMSYSHDSEAHKDWVRSLAETLTTAHDIHVLLDQWDNDLGSDLPAFMAKIRDADRVLVVCTPSYVEKANNHEGGVGYEGAIVTAELADDLTTNKFVPILREGEFKSSSFPVWLGGRLGADFTKDGLFDEEVKNLARALRGVPRHQRPPRGKGTDVTRSDPS